MAAIIIPNHRLLRSSRLPGFLLLYTVRMEKLFLMNEECNAAPITWKFSSFDEDFFKHDLNSASDRLQSGFSGADWGNSVELCDPLESALSSIVSSPAASNVGASFNSTGDKLMVRELIGRLGSIYEVGDIPRTEHIWRKKDNANPSYYSTPLNSAPKLNLSMKIPEVKGHSSFFATNALIHPSLKRFSSDPEFAAKTAMYSSLAAGNGGSGKEIPTIHDVESQIAIQEHRNSPIQRRTSLCKKSRKLSRALGRDNAEIGDSREGSSLSEQISCSESAMKEKDENDLNDRKRKLISNVISLEKPPPPSKIAKIEGKNERTNPGETSASKNDGTKMKTETNEGKKSGEDESQKCTKLPEPPKDYIHVRARRGQATDSHSLAERVRREKISERMKFLQDLVPGCNKVTGKAVMLDEIINFVQSLQRQVEFLSMKLASVPPSMNLNREALLSRDIIQSCASLQHIKNPLDSSSTAFEIDCQRVPSETEISYPINSQNPFLCRNPDIQTINLNGYIKDDDQQVFSSWEDDLQSVVQMGFGQNQQQNSRS